MINALVSSQALLVLLCNELLEQYIFSGKSRKTYMDNELRTVEQRQKEWRNLNYETTRELPHMSKWQAGQMFVGDQWIFAGQDSSGQEEMVYSDEFGSHARNANGMQMVKWSDATYANLITSAIDKIYPERMPDLSPEEANRVKFQDAPMDRMIYEECQEANWAASRTIRHPQLVGPKGYEVTPSFLRLEEIASFCKCTLKEAKELQDAYKLLDLDFNQVRGINAQIRKRPVDRKPMDTVITDWHTPEQFTKRVHKFASKAARQKYAKASKRELWNAYRLAKPEVDIHTFDKEFPDNRMTLNQLLEKYLLPVLQEEKQAEMIEAGKMGDIGMYEALVGICETRGWKITDTRSEAGVDAGMEFDFEAAMAVELEDLDEKASVRIGKPIDQLPYTYWATGLIKEDKTLYGTPEQRELYKKAVRAIGRAKSRQDLFTIKSHVGQKLTWEQYKPIVALLNRKSKILTAFGNKKPKTTVLPPVTEPDTVWWYLDGAGEYTVEPEESQHAFRPKIVRRHAAA